MAKKLKLGSEIVSLSDEAFANLGRPDAAPSVSPYQSALQGSQPDQAKMTGSSAQLGAQARRLAAPPTDTLREAIRTRQPTQVQGPAGARPFDYEKAARVDEALAGVFAQQMTLAQVGTLGFDRDKALAAGYNPTQLDTLKPVIDKLLAGMQLSVEEDKALRTLFQSDPNYKGPESMKEIAANLIAEPDDAIVTALKDQIKSGTANFIFASIPQNKLDIILLDQGMAEKTKDGKMDYSYIQDILGPNWKNMSYQDWLNEVTKRRESFTDVKQLQLLYTDPQLSPAAKHEVRQQLLNLGYSGVLADMSAAEQLEVDARNGYSLTIGGKEYAIDEIMDGVVLEGVVSAALGAGPGSDQWNKLEPELKQWMEDNYYTLLSEYERTTGLLATGLEKGILRAEFAENLTKAGFNPELFQDHMTLELLTQFSAYDEVPNGIVPFLKGQTDPKYIPTLIASLKLVLGQENQAIIDAVFKQPRWFTRQITLDNGQQVTETVESAGARILKELSTLTSDQAAVRMATLAQDAKEYETVYSGTPHDFAKAILGVDDPQTFLTQLNTKFQNPNLTANEKANFNAVLDYNKDGTINMQDFADRQARFKATGESELDTLAKFKFTKDTQLEQEQSSVAAASKMLETYFTAAQKREADAKAKRDANTNFDTLMAPHLNSLKEFNIEVPNDLKDRFVKTYIEKGVVEAEKVINQFTGAYNFEQMRADRIAKQEEIQKIQETNTGIFTNWNTTYGGGGISTQVNYRSRLTQGNAFADDYTPYQRLQDRTFWILRLRLQNSGIMPPGFTSYEQMEEEFYKGLREGRGVTEILLTGLHTVLKNELTSRVVRVTYQRRVGSRGVTIPTTIYVHKDNVDPKTKRLKKGISPTLVQQYNPETGLPKPRGT